MFLKTNKYKLIILINQIISYKKLRKRLHKRLQG